MSTTEDQSRLKETVEQVEGLAIKMQEIADRKDSIDKEAMDKIAKDSADALKVSNDILLSKKQADEAHKKLEEKCEALEREMYRKGTPHAAVTNKIARTNEENQAIKSFLTDPTPGFQMLTMPQIKEINVKTLNSLIDTYHPRETEEGKERIRRKYWVEGDDTQGGYLVHPEISNMFIRRDLNSGSIKAWANLIPMATAEMLIAIDDDISIRAVWEGELGPVNVQETAVIGQTRLVAKSMYVDVPASHEFLEDANQVNPEQFIADKINLRFLLTENEAVINGTGAKELKGILEYKDWTAPGAYTRDAIERVTTETAGEIGYNDLINMNTALRSIYQDNAAWFLSSSAWNAILKIKDLNDSPIIKPATGLVEGFRGMTILGHPVVLLDQLPQWDTTLPIPSLTEAVILGDYKKALTMGDRLTTRIVPDIFTDKAVVKFNARRRMGFLLTSYDGIKILKIQ